MELFALLIALAVVVAVWFLPCLVAGWRDHPQSGPILIVTLFLAWTGIGWVVALAWACSAITGRESSPARPRAAHQSQG